MRGVLLAFEMPDDWWCTRLSRTYPQLDIQILNLVPTRAGRGIKTLQFNGADAGRALEWMTDHDLIGDGMVLHREKESVLMRVAIPVSPLVAIIRATGIVPQFPFAVRGNEVRWLLLDDGGSTRRLLDWLRVNDYPVRTIRSGEWLTAWDDMTHRQRRIFETAVDTGFYDYPRRITLTALAEKLGVCKSTLSEALMVIEHKVMQAHRGQESMPVMKPATVPQARGFHVTS